MDASCSRRFYPLDQHGHPVDCELRHEIRPERHHDVIGEVERRQRRKRQPRRAIDDDEIEVHAEVLHQPLHAAAHLHGDGIGMQLPLGGLHHEQLVLDVLEPLRSRQQRDASRPKKRPWLTSPTFFSDVGGFVLGHFLEAVGEVVGDGMAAREAFSQPSPPTSMREALHCVSRSISSTCR